MHLSLHAFQKRYWDIREYMDKRSGKVVCGIVLGISLLLFAYTQLVALPPVVNTLLPLVDGSVSALPDVRSTSEMLSKLGMPIATESLADNLTAQVESPDGAPQGPPVALVPDTTPPSGEHDESPQIESGPPRAGSRSPQVDSGTTPVDLSGSTPTDSGSTPVDSSGSTPTDSGSTPVDPGESTSTDSTSTPVDTGASSECGGASWVRTYTALHNAATSRGRHLFEDPSLRYVIYDCSDYDQERDLCGGLGDMLVGIVSTFAFALLSNRVFLIRAAAIEAAFESHHIQWKIPGNLSTQIPFYSNVRSERVVHYSLDDNVKASTVNTYNIDGENSAEGTARVLIDALSYNTQIIVHRSNRGVMHEFLNQKWPHIVQQMNNLGLYGPSQAFNCLIRFILQPTPIVTAAISTYLERIHAPNTFVVGIHARTGDHSMEIVRDASEQMAQMSREIGAVMLKKHRRLFACADMLAHQMTQGTQTVLWFLASDSADLKAAAKAHYGDNVFSTDFTPKHLSHRYETREELEDAVKWIVGEWVLFSECNVHVFRLSGWSTTSTLFSRNYDTAFVFPRRKGKWYTEDIENLCRVGRPNPLDAEGQMWSGI